MTTAAGGTMTTIKRITAGWHAGRRGDVHIDITDATGKPGPHRWNLAEGPIGSQVSVGRYASVSEAYTAANVQAWEDKR